MGSSLETPAMDLLETLLGKYSQERDQLIFRLLHRGAELGRAHFEKPLGRRDAHLLMHHRAARSLPTTSQSAKRLVAGADS
jgi:hypothetical protein